MLDSLPPELLPRIIQSLDSFSIYSLLQASPNISRHCVVLLTYEDDKRGMRGKMVTTPSFFMKGVRFMDAYRFNPETHRFLVKIYESYLPKCWGKEQGIDFLRKHLPFVSKNESFVHCCMGVYNRMVDEGTIDRDEITYSAILREEKIPFQMNLFRPHGPKVLEIDVHYPLDQVRRSIRGLEKDPDPWGALCTLSISGMDVIENLQISNRTFNISFIFGKSSNRPLLRKVTLGDYVASLRIHYYDHLPIFEGCCFEVKTNTILEIAHIPALSGLLTEPLPVHPAPLEHTVCFASLFKCKPAFSELIVIGGHDAILWDLDYTNINRLTWKQASRQISRVYSLRIPGLRQFKFESVLENARIPSIVITPKLRVSDYSPYVLSVTAHHGLILEDLPFDGSKISQMFFHCVRNEEPRGELVPFLEDLPITASMNSLRYVSLIGLNTRGDLTNAVEEFKHKLTVLLENDPRAAGTVIQIRDLHILR